MRAPAPTHSLGAQVCQGSQITCPSYHLADRKTLRGSERTVGPRNRPVPGWCRCPARVRAARQLGAVTSACVVQCAEPAGGRDRVAPPLPRPRPFPAPCPKRNKTARAGSGPPLRALPTAPRDPAAGECAR